MQSNNSQPQTINWSIEIAKAFKSVYKENKNVNKFNENKKPPLNQTNSAATAQNLEQNIFSQLELSLIGSDSSNITLANIDSQKQNLEICARLLLLMLCEEHNATQMNGYTALITKVKKDLDSSGSSLFSAIFAHLSTSLDIQFRNTIDAIINPTTTRSRQLTGIDNVNVKKTSQVFIPSSSSSSTPVSSSLSSTSAISFSLSSSSSSSSSSSNSAVSSSEPSISINPAAQASATAVPLSSSSAHPAAPVDHFSDKMNEPNENDKQLFVNNNKDNPVVSSPAPSESDIAAPAGSLLGGGSLPTYTFYTPEEYHTQTLVPEDKLLKNLFKIYELNYYNLLKASEGQADLEAFNRLEEANKKIAALLLQITKLRVEKPAYAGGNDDTLAKKFLTQIKQDFVTLQKKMQRVSQTNTPQTHYRYFSSGFDEVSAHEHRTRLTNSNVDTHLPLAAGSADKPTIAALKDKTSAEVYRWHDKNPKHESSFFEYVKQGGIGSYEITIVDLPEAISDRGLLKIFLTQENLMRSGLESELRHLSPTLTKDKLIEFFKKQNISEGFFKTNASLADDFLKFAEKKRLTSTNRTTIPNEAIFIEAARILNTVLAAGQMPFQFDQANNIPLMTAIDMLVRLHEIEDKIMITAKNYQVTPSSAQLNIVNMLKNQKPDVYTLKVASVLEKTEALTKQLNSSP